MENYSAVQTTWLTGSHPCPTAIRLSLTSGRFMCTGQNSLFKPVPDRRITGASLGAVNPQTCQRF